MVYEGYTRSLAVGNDVLQLREHLGGGGGVELIAPQLYPHGFVVGQVGTIQSRSQIVALGVGRVG